MTATVEEVTEATEEVRAALGRLLPQLNPALGAPPPELLERIVADQGTVLLVARSDGRIAGTATIAVHATPAGMRAHVHDVVVDEAARGKGLGRALMQAAIQVARRRGAQAVRLTSADHRTEAHRLYEDLGFRRLASRLYRLDL